MGTPRMTRRSVLGAAVAAAVAPAAAQKGGRTGMVRLGGPVFAGGNDPDKLAEEHVRLGYRAAYCPGVSVDDTARIRAIREAFARRDVVIAEVGAWCNIIGPEDDQRKANIANVTRQLALADEVGARCCVDFAGTRRPGAAFGPHPDNFTQDTFDLIVTTARTVIDAVKPKRAKFCLEMMQTIPPDGIEEYARLVRAIDRPGFGVHLDPVNCLYKPRDCYASGRMLKECFERLGRWIVSCHAKDLRVRDDLAVHIDECLPGTGLLDYGAYVRGLANLGRDVPLMLEHLASEAEYAKARAFVSGVIAAEGVGAR